MRPISDKHCNKFQLNSTIGISLKLGQLLGQIPISIKSNVKKPSSYLKKVNYYATEILVVYSLVLYVSYLYLRIKFYIDYWIPSTADNTYEQTWSLTTTIAEYTPDSIIAIVYIIQLLVSYSKRSSIIIISHQISNYNNAVEKCLENSYNYAKFVSITPKIKQSLSCYHRLMLVIPALWIGAGVMKSVCVLSFVMNYREKDINNPFMTSMESLFPTFLEFIGLLWPLLLLLQLGGVLANSMIALRNYSQNIVNKFSKDGQDCLRTLRPFYGDLKNILQDFCKVFSMSLLLNFSNFFIHMAFGGYVVVINFIKSGKITHPQVMETTYMLFLLFYFLFVSLFCICASTLMEQYVDTIKVLFTIPPNQQTHQLLIFIKDLEINRPSLSAAGLFLIGKETMLKIVGTVVGYLVIMIQFNEGDPNHFNGYNVKE